MHSFSICSVCTGVPLCTSAAVSIHFWFASMSLLHACAGDLLDTQQTQQPSAGSCRTASCPANPGSNSPLNCCQTHTARTAPPAVVEEEASSEDRAVIDASDLQRRGSADAHPSRTNGAPDATGHLEAGGSASALESTSPGAVPSASGPKGPAPAGKSVSSTAHSNDGGGADGSAQVSALYNFLGESGHVEALVDVAAGADPALDRFDVVRTGVGGTVPMLQATQHIVRAIFDRFRRRLPRHRIRCILQQMLDAIQGAPRAVDARAAMAEGGGQESPSQPACSTSSSDAADGSAVRERDIVANTPRIVATEGGHPQRPGLEVLQTLGAVSHSLGTCLSAAILCIDQQV